jgi:hypothetical protein
MAIQTRHRTYLHIYLQLWRQHRQRCQGFVFRLGIFEPVIVKISMGEGIELNNPTLYTIAEAVQSLQRDGQDIHWVILSLDGRVRLRRR